MRFLKLASCRRNNPARYAHRHIKEVGRTRAWCSLPISTQTWTKTNPLSRNTEPKVHVGLQAARLRNFFSLSLQRPAGDCLRNFTQGRLRLRLLYFSLLMCRFGMARADALLSDIAIRIMRILSVKIQQLLGSLNLLPERWTKVWKICLCLIP